MPRSKNNKSKVKSKSKSKSKQEKKIKRAKKSDEGAVLGAKPTGFKYASPPVATQLVAGQEEYARVTGRGKDKNGLEFVTVSGRQKLASGLLRSTSTAVLADSTGTAINALPLSPYYCGGMMGRVASAYEQYRFKRISIQYCPTSGTNQTAGIAMSYLPFDPDVATLPLENEGGLLAALYDRIISMASVATGPVWGPIVSKVGSLLGEIGPPMVEAAYKWFDNRKVQAFTAAERTAMESGAQESDLSAYLTALNAWLVANAGVLPAGTPPVVGHVADYVLDSRARRDAMNTVAFRQWNQEMVVSSKQSVQGLFAAAANAKYTTSEPNSDPVTGTAPCGDFYIDYAIELSNPQGNQRSVSETFGTSGDPLDVSDPTDPYHLTASVADRSVYLLTALKHFNILLSPIRKTPVMAVRRPTRDYLEELRALSVSYLGVDEVQITDVHVEPDFKTMRATVWLAGQSFTGSGETRSLAILTAARDAVSYISTLDPRSLEVYLKTYEIQQKKAIVSSLPRAAPVATTTDLTTGSSSLCEKPVAMVSRGRRGSDWVDCSASASSSDGEATFDPIADLNVELAKANLLDRAAPAARYEQIPPQGVSARRWLKLVLARFSGVVLPDSLKSAMSRYARSIGVPTRVSEAVLEGLTQH